MNEKRRQFQHLVLVLAFLLSTYMPVAGQADFRPAGTIVGGIIDTDTTWTKAGSPYEVTSIVTVVSNVTLTIEPGVEVRFAPDTRLAVNGTLHAVGEAGNEILFTGSTQTPGSWQGIWITAASGIRSLDNRLQHVIVEYGGAGIANPANLYTADADIIVRHGIFRNGSGNGFTAWSGVTAELSDVQFINNQGYAARFLEQDSDPALAHLTASGNGTDAVGVGGIGTPIEGAHTWEAMGLPYIANSLMTVGMDGRLLVEAGVEVRFADDARLEVKGQLSAMGTPDLPITFTAVNKVPGAWDGIVFAGGGNKAAVGDFSYATVEYGGGGFYAANIYVTSGRVAINHSIIRNSVVDGLHLGPFSSRSSILGSQITGNAGYGVQTQDTDPAALDVVASSNWWGHSSGPRSDTTCNPGAAGDRVSANVVFEPFLTAGTENPGAVPASGAYTISISPRRWYAPANGTKVYVDITVYDGTGSPAPGRKVSLHTTLGNVETGPVTGPDGKVIATVSAGSPGEAELTATLEDLDACSSALSETARITFEEMISASEGITDPLAPYVNKSLKIDPLPVTVGVPTNLIAEITNPFDFDVYVDAIFDYAQFGIGLTFGPAGEVFDFLIPAGQTRTITVIWTPQVSGHICIKLDYTLYKLVEGGLYSVPEKKFPVAKGSDQQNTDSNPAKASSAQNAFDEGKYWQAAISDMSDLLNATTEFAFFVGMYIPNQLFGNILRFINEAGGGIICGSGGGTQCGGYNGPTLSLPLGSVGSMWGDPPRQDYTIVAVPETYTYPTLEPGPDMPAARAEVFNSMMAASFDLMGKQWATVLTYDRYSGATKAKDITWASVQANAYIYYLNETAQAMIAYENAIEDLIAELKAEGYTDIVRTPEDWQAIQDRLGAEGWSDVEKQAAAIAGITPEGLELIRQAYLAADPARMEGSVYDSLQYRADFYGDLGRMLLDPPELGPITRMGASSMTPSTLDEEPAETYPLARIAPMEQTIQIGNPLTTTATIELEVRPLGLPADWLVTLSETELVLDVGQSVTVTVMIRPGLPVAQGTQPGLAVEGFVDGQLIGGLAIDVVVPYYVDFTHPFRVYLPMLLR